MEKDGPIDNSPNHIRRVVPTIGDARDAAEDCEYRERRGNCGHQQFEMNVGMSPLGSSQVEEQEQAGKR